VKVKVIYLRTARERKHLTQVELASISHVAQNTISKLERRADRSPLWDTARALAAALNVDPQDLRWGPDPARTRARQRRRVTRQVA
jgi:transcriptional regulator with XRE-family HTH domain